MPRRARFLVIGGGVAGLSTAYYLAEKKAGSVLVLEQEKKLGGHASGRNAGMIRQSVEDPVLAYLAVEGRKLLGRWPGIGFESPGSLLLAKRGKRPLLEKIWFNLNGTGTPARMLNPAQAVERVPLLKDADFDHALFCSSDALVDIQRLLKKFLVRLKEKNVRVLCGVRPTRI